VLKTLALRLVIVTHFLCFVHSLQGNARTVPLLRPQLLPSISLPIHHSLVILSFSAM
jgi:hypothetical protein